MNNETKNILLKALGIMAITFVTAFLAFYIALSITLDRLTSPKFFETKLDKIVKSYEKDMQKFERDFEEHPFLPKTKPMPVNLVKENNEYKIIVNLKPLEGNENGVDVKIKDNVISINAEIEKNTHRGDEIVKFSQSYYLDEKLLTDNLKKEKVGDKYIITIPFKD